MSNIWNTRRFRKKIQAMSYEQLYTVSWLECVDALRLANVIEPEVTIKVHLLDYWRTTGDKKVFRDFCIAGEFFDLDRYIVFIKMRMQGWAVSRLDDCIVRFGEVFGKRLHEEACAKQAKVTAGYYNPAAWIAKGLTMEEAETKVKEHRSKTAQTLDAFINRHGKEDGTRRFNIFVQKSIQTLDKFIERYGDYEGRKRWATLQHARDTNSDAYFQATFGDDWKTEKAKRAIGTTVTRERYQKRYGDIEGDIRYNALVQSRIKKILPGATTASLALIIPLAAYLAEKGIKFYTGNNKKEYHIYSHVLKRHLFFDFVVPTLQLAIEYHGIHCHSKPSLTDSDRNAWCCAYRGLGYEEVLAIDKAKKKALHDERGFDMIEVFSDDFDTDPAYWINHCIAEFERRLG